MSLALVPNTENILQFKSRNNERTIDMLKQLLLMAESDQLIGIAGVFFTLVRGEGSFAAGEACERTADTIYELERLQLKMQG